MKRLVLLPFILTLSQCGKGPSPEEIAAQGDYQDLPTIAPSPALPPPSDGSGSGGVDDTPVFGSQPVSSQTTACGYWNTLSDQGGMPFRIVDGLSVKTIKQNDVNVAVVHGKHNLSELPQVRYLISQEYADSMLTKETHSDSFESQRADKPPCKELSAAPGKTPLDPPTIEQFMLIAEEKYECGELSSTEWYGLQALHSLAKWNASAKKTLLQTRNDRMTDEVEKQLPGVFRGQSVPLTKSKLMAEFLKAANLLSLTPANLESLRPLEKRVSLFVAGDWSAQRRDMEQVMRILDATSVDPAALSLEEQACRFALSQRATSQMLVTKGLGGTPQLQSSGLLNSLPAEEVAVYPKRDEVGRYGIIVNRAWIMDQLNYPTARLDNVQDTENFLHLLRYFVSWTRYRSAEMWTPIGSSLAEPGKLQIPSELLELGFGFFGITAKIMANEELIIGEDRSIHLKQDSARNLAILAVLALEVQDTYKGLVRPTPFESALLGPDKLNEFTAPYPDGVVARFQLLTSGIVFEGLKRIREGETSEELKEALRAIGRKIGNPILANLE